MVFQKTKIRLLPIFIFVACLSLSIKISLVAGSFVRFEGASFKIGATAAQAEEQAATKETEELTDVLNNGSESEKATPQNAFTSSEIMILQELAERREALDSKAKILVSGGYIEKSVFSLLGQVSENLFKNTHVDMAFIGLDGLDIEYGASVRSFSETAVKQAMIKSADKVVALLDSSKIKQKMLVKFAEVEEFDYIITNEMSEEEIKAYKEKGVEVIIA